MRDYGKHKLEAPKKGKIITGSTDSSYPTNWVDDVTQCPQHHVQSVGHKLDPRVDPLPIPHLYDIIEGEECHP
jgi:hypothetical protein